MFAGLLVLYVLSSFPVDYYLGYQFGRDGGRYVGDHVGPRWRETLYRPLSATAQYLHFDAVEYQLRCWNLGFRAGDQAYLEANARAQKRLAP
jgi:hypothetical protein